MKTTTTPRVTDRLRAFREKDGIKAFGERDRVRAFPLSLRERDGVRAQLITNALPSIPLRFH
jgi:hypothetical protein